MAQNGTHLLTAWEKLGIMATGGAFVGLTVLIVVCALGPGCCLFRILHGCEDEPVVRTHRKKYRVRIRSTSDFIEDSDEGRIHRLIESPFIDKDNSINQYLEQEEIALRSKDVNRDKLSRSQRRGDSTYGSMSSGRSSPVTMSQIGAAFSTLSISLSRSPSVKKSVALASPPMSPSSSSSSVATGRSVAHRTSSWPKDSKEKSPLTSVSLSVMLTAGIADIQENGEATQTGTSQGKLAIVIHDLKNLPPRDYCSTRDPFVRILILRDRRSLRKRSKQVLSEFSTKTIRHNLDPVFEESFESDLSMSDLKNIRIKIVAMDHDRHTKTSPIGSTSILLKDFKSLTSSHEPISMMHFLPQKKQEFGEVMFGLSYLPTAQRVSFNIVKATNLKFEEVVENLEAFRPYVRIVQMNHAGKAVKKKKTAFQEATKEPVFNETLNFDVSPNQLESVSFVILVSHKRQSTSDDEMQHLHDETLSALTDQSESGTSAPSTARAPSPFTRSNPNSVRSRDTNTCVGRVCIGAHVRGEKERNHWSSVVSSPRKVFTMWQTLY